MVGSPSALQNVHEFPVEGAENNESSDREHDFQMQDQRLFRDFATNRVNLEGFLQLLSRDTVVGPVTTQGNRDTSPDNSYSCNRRYRNRS